MKGTKSMSKREFEAVNMNDESYKPTINEIIRCNKLCFHINQTEPMTEKMRNLTEELFENRLDKTSNIMPPFQIDLANRVNIGKNVFINNNLICMARGSITIDDDVMIGPGVSLLTANHDFDDHRVLLCSPIHIHKNAWIGARAVILPGVTIGENAVVAGGAVVTKDVEANTVVGGNPVKVLKKLK